MPPIFLKARQIVGKNAPNHIVTMQFFQRRNDTKLCGVDEAIALVHTFAVHPEELEIEAFIKEKYSIRKK